VAEGLSGPFWRALFLTSVRFFYRDIGRTGDVPAAGPVIVVANHPNGLLDPLVVRLALHQPVAFLAKSTLWDIRPLRSVLAAFRAIPVYRAHEADTRQNATTFDRCRELLADRGWLALFPEGTSHDAPDLLPLKTGAARIALASPEARILPVGLLYDDKETFRSRVSVAVGEPIDVTTWSAQWRAEHGDDERAEAADLTDRIAQALGAVMVRAQSDEVRAGLLAVAAWTSPDGGRDIAALHARARELGARYAALAEQDPDAIEPFAHATRRLVRTLETVGIHDPLALETVLPSPVAFARTLAPLVLLAPIALVGAILGWIPYYAVRPLSLKVATAGQKDLVSTYKTLLGLPIIGGWWLAEAIVAGIVGGPLAALAMAVLAPATGYVALRWGERYDLRSELLRAGWLVLTRARLAEAVAERRRGLAALVAEAMAAAPPSRTDPVTTHD
jgi:1-acyl-sn-glycerol-3-phosphate acyltransferase